MTKMMGLATAIVLVMCSAVVAQDIEDFARQNKEEAELLKEEAECKEYLAENAQTDAFAAKLIATLQNRHFDLYLGNPYMEEGDKYYETGYAGPDDAAVKQLQFGNDAFDDAEALFEVEDWLEANQKYLEAIDFYTSCKELSDNAWNKYQLAIYYYSGVAW